VEILLWLVPAAAVTAVAMVWAAWAGRPQRESTTRSDADYAKFARAISNGRPVAAPGRTLLPRERDRSTGIAVRPSRRPQAQPRRSA